MTVDGTIRLERPVTGLQIVEAVKAAVVDLTGDEDTSNLKFTLPEGFEAAKTSIVDLGIMDPGMLGDIPVDEAEQFFLEFREAVRARLEKLS